jgi:hypothetical protein
MMRLVTSLRIEAWLLENTWPLKLGGQQITAPAAGAGTVPE